MGLEEIRVTKGKVILRQGEFSEYYYLIKSGQCILSRKPSINARDIKLAQLRSGDTFGEDWLLIRPTDKRDVTTLTDLTLLRLNKEKFISLIKIPALKYIKAAELVSETKAGAYIVDVRLQDDFTAWHLEGSINAPFFSLLMQLKTFDRKRTVIVVCNDGKASAAAAFLLLRNKFDAKILENGLDNLPPDHKDGSISFVHNAQLRRTFLDNSAAGTGLPSANVPETITYEQLMAENKSLKKLVLKLKQQCSALQLIEEQYQLLVEQQKSG